MTELSDYAYEIAKSRYFNENETKWSQLAERICRENAKNEVADQEKYYEDFMSIIEPMYFIPAGRILRNLGKIRPSTSNCNVLPIADNIESIFETLKHYGIISAYGGGSGINFSTLRPRGAILSTRGGKSSGMVSFIEVFNFAGSKLETGGQRRSAGIALCSVYHPEVLDFIDAKIEHNKLTQFNISVTVDKHFLKAVEEDADWELKFSGKVYKVIKARYIWDKILGNMLKHAEPGIINWDNLKKNNSYYFAPISACNPCSELALEDFGVCNIGSLVLPKFVTNVNTDWRKLEDAIYKSVRFMDNIIDLAFYPIPQQEVAAKDSRRIGIGTMGLADYMFMKKIRYGSDKCIQEIERLYKFIRDTTYLASVKLSKEKGAFPKYNKSDYMGASFVRKLPAKIRMEIRENAIRNVTTLMAAPTGTTSLLAGVVGGVEPLPFKGYRRADGVGERIYIHDLARDNVTEDWFVDSMDLKPEEHLEVQSTIQRFLDGGISKTLLVPEKTTVEDLDKYLMEYIHDIKGVTLYRNESRKEQVYYRLSEEEIQKHLNNAETTLTLEDVDCSSGSCDV